MKKFFILALVLSAPLAFAQSGNIRYCPDPARDFFKGSIYHEQGRPWIEVIVDPDFEQNELREKRHITGNIPLTPVYDLVVRIKPEFNYYCIPGWVEGKKITASDLPTSAPVKASIVVGAADEEITEPGFLLRMSEQDAQDRFVYEMHLKGWMSGIAPNEKLERLIEAVSKNEPVNVLLEITEPRGGVERVRRHIPFGLCVPVWGGGRHGIVGAYTTGTTLAAFRVPFFDTVRVDGFARTEPFRKYQNLFSYFVELQPSRSSSAVDGLMAAIKNARLAKGRVSITVQNSALAQIVGETSCGGGKVILRHTDNLPREGIALVGAAIQGALLNSINPVVAVHEFAHTFAFLNDEYVYKEQAFTTLSLTNCSFNPGSDYLFDGKMYGSAGKQGCSFLYRTEGSRVGDRSYFYRPSENSIMREHEEDSNFNVVSCGWILSAIKGGDAKSHFPECAKMDGVIKDGVQASALYPFFVWLGAVFNPTSYGPQVAQVGASIPVTGQYLIIESFDPNDPWGEIIEVIPDTAASSPTVPPATAIPSSPTSFESIGDEGIFGPALSLDLKVNGSDGPVEVGRGERMVISWLSEGAHRCRGVWSRNDIAKSGTIAGRLSRAGTMTIRAACTDEVRNRRDDSVVVSVRE